GSTATAVAAPDEDLQWYCRVAGMELGPVGFDDLLRMAENGELTADEDVRFGATGPWRKVGAIGRLVAVLPYQEHSGLRPTQFADGATASTPVSLPEPAVPAVPAAVPIEPPKPQYHPSAEQATWFAWIRGSEFGPASLVQLSQWVTTGQLGPADFVKQG